MTNILLLYDTLEEAFARYFKDFLEMLDLAVRMIPKEPDKGLTLPQKEEYYFKNADGAIFILTPGSERKGEKYPSPSLINEMDLAKKEFQERPERVIHLLEEGCKIPSIIEIKTYIPFDRKNSETIITALTQLVNNLKDVGLLRPASFALLPSQANKLAWGDERTQKLRESLWDEIVVFEDFFYKRTVFGFYLIVFSEDADQAAAFDMTSTWFSDYKRKFEDEPNTGELFVGFSKIMVHNQNAFKIFISKHKSWKNPNNQKEYVLLQSKYNSAISELERLFVRANREEAIRNVSIEIEFAICESFDRLPDL